MATTTFLKPEHFAPIRNLSLRAKLIVEGMIAGMHKSPYHGFSAEFLEYRPYLHGESTRRIDWRKFAKTDRTVVRLFEDETNLQARLLLDKSGSMGFSSRNNLTKYDYARTLAASLAWILIRQRDAVGLMMFDRTVTEHVPPHSTNRQLKLILSTLDRIQTSSLTRCGDAIDAAAVSIRKRGLCIILSDLFDDTESVIRGLRHLRFKKQDIIVLRILDPFELSFSGTSPVRFRDLESGETIQLDPRTASAYFSEGLAANQKIIERACRELGIDFETLSTSEPFQKALMRVLEKRRRLF
jgi:uncharacterized protein (DUF58 family)